MTRSDQDLPRAIQQLNTTALRRNLSPYFQQQFDSAVQAGSADSGVAMLVSGAVHTMLHEDSVRDWAHSIGKLRRHGMAVQVFAFLDVGEVTGPEQELWRRGAAAARRRKALQQIKDVLEQWAPQSWELGVEPSVDDSRHPLLPDAHAVCLPPASEGPGAIRNDGYFTQRVTLMVHAQHAHMYMHMHIHMHMHMHMDMDMAWTRHEYEHDYEHGIYTHGICACTAVHAHLVTVHVRISCDTLRRQLAIPATNRLLTADYIPTFVMHSMCGSMQRWRRRLTLCG